MFYPNVPSVAKGEQAVLCYGVANAASLELDPPVEQLTPSFNRCFGVTPARTTVYTLTAKGAGDSTDRQSVTVHVGAAAPASPSAPDGLITRFDARSTSVAAGAPATLCFAATAAAKVTLHPPQGFPGGKMGCFTVEPAATTTYTLTAVRGSEKSSRSVTVKVN